MARSRPDAWAKPSLRSRLDDLAVLVELAQEESDAASLTEAENELISLRKDLRSAKQFDLADKVREQLAELGVTLEDTKQGTIWKSS